MELIKKVIDRVYVVVGIGMLGLIVYLIWYGVSSGLIH
jgi:hypothetical protein